MMSHLMIYLTHMIYSVMDNNVIIFSLIGMCHQLLLYYCDYIICQSSSAYTNFIKH